MSSSRSKSFHKNSSDWSCSDPACGNLNFARRNECNRCKKPKPRESSSKKKGPSEIGSAAAKSSRGLFSADDWSCTKCGNINWARRNQCNICNAKKFIDEEERTGLGGGFNEREKVEYKSRRSSSDSCDYDEFGRKKKNRKKSSTEASSRKSRRDRSSSSSSRSRSRSRRRRDSSSTTTSSSSSSAASRRSRDKSRSRSPLPKKSASRRSKSRSHSSDERSQAKRNTNQREEKRREKSESRSNSSSNEEEDDDDDDEGGDLSKYNLFDDDDIDLQAFKK